MQTILVKLAGVSFGAGLWFGAPGHAASPDPNLIWIPPGTFTMGSATNEPNFNPAHGPPHQVTITHGFWMNRYEVTQGEYASIKGVNPSQFSGNTNRPVERVNWFEAMNYCELLNVRESAAGRLPAGYNYRLPTEAEWEYACRAGMTNIWSWGNDSNVSTNYAWHGPNSGGTSHPVGQKLPNPWGLYDMHGNVSEWVWDWARGYTTAPQVEPVGSVSGLNKPTRGGAFYDSAGYVRSGSRWVDRATNNTWHGWGFRVVLASALPAHFTDFEGTVSAEWSASKVSIAPVGGRKFLGDFGNQTATLSLSNLPSHAAMRVSFDLLIIRSWDGNSTTFGPDVWSLRVRSGPTLLQSTFSNNRNNAGLRQSYPATHSEGTYPGFTGAAEAGTLGYPPNLGYGSSIMDSVYRLASEFVHTNQVVQLDFAGLGLQSLPDESWGLDNVQVTVLGAPSDPAVTTQPQSQIVTATHPTTLIVSSSGTAPLFFQWQKDGVDIPGATNAAWATFRASTNDAGIYRVVVSNAWGNVTSSNAVLVVVTPPGLTASQLAFQPGGGVDFHLTPPAGVRAIVEASADLQNWIVLLDTVTNGSSLTAADPAAVGSRGRFYRVLYRLP